MDGFGWVVGVTCLFLGMQMLSSTTEGENYVEKVMLLSVAVLICVYAIITIIVSAN